MFYLLLSTSDVVEFITKVKPTIEVEEGLELWSLGYMRVINTSLNLVEVEKLPLGQIEKKYCYRDGEFIINPSYIEPVVTTEDLYVVRQEILQQGTRQIEAELDTDYRLSLLELGLA